MLNSQVTETEHFKDKLINPCLSNEASAFPAFEITTISIDGSSVAGFCHAPRRNDYGLLYIQKGSGAFQIDCNQFEAKDNMVISILPRQVVRHSKALQMEGSLIRFSKEFLMLSEPSRSMSFMDPIFGYHQTVIYPDEENKLELHDLLKKMEKEQSAHHKSGDEMLRGLLKVFILYLVRNIDLVSRHNILDKDRNLMRSFLSLVNAHFYTRKLVVDYAKELCVSPNYLNKVIKRVSGYTARHHIQMCIILEAKRYALHSGLSLKEVAYLLGFDDYSHFSKYFKNISGINFSAYKNQLL